MTTVPTLKTISEDIPDVSGDLTISNNLLLDTSSPASTAEAASWFILPGNNMPISDSASMIFQAIAPTNTMFYRGGSIVEIDTSSELAEFKLIQPSQFCSAIERYGRSVGKYLKNSNTGNYALNPTDCKKSTAEQLMAAKEANEILPKVSAISNCAILVHENDASEILAPGYHKFFGGVFISQKEPTREVELEEAVPALLSLLRDFKFQSEADRSRALASFLTPALRFGGHIAGNIPVDVSEADLSQSGKSYRQQVIAALYGESVQVVTQVRGLGGGDEPFFNALCRGRPFIQFDNWRGKLDSQSLESFVTANGEFGIRGAYRKWGSVDSRKFYLMLSSNGFETTQDFCNRSNIIRITKQPENYSFVKYDEGSLLEHVRCHQSYYLGCVFSVIRSWLSRGQPRTDDNRHDFREWCQICDWIVQELFGLAPLMNGHQKAKERARDPRLSWLRKIALAVKSRDMLGCKLTSTDLLDLGDEESIDLPVNAKSDDSSNAVRKVGAIMRKLFSDKSEIGCEGFDIRREEMLLPRADRENETYAVKAYVFVERSSPRPH